MLPVRSIDKGKALKQEIREKTGSGSVELVECKLDALESVRQFARQFKEKHDRLHILVNNAGIWEAKHSLSEDGIEMNFAVNHLAPFLMTNLLMDTVKASAPARIINVSSNIHKQVPMNFDDLESQKRWQFGMRAYAQSKLANILFTRKLASDLNGSGITVNCMHPGVVNTRLFNQLPAFIRKPFNLFMISPDKGAQTVIYLATSPEVKDVTGEYFIKKRIAQTSRHARNMQVAEKLWEVSKAYCGI